MRWTLLGIADERCDADDESCGPDASTLASSFTVNRKATVTTKPITGEFTEETVKTIAWGMPGTPVLPVVTNSYAFLLCMREAAGVTGIPDSHALP